MVRIALVGCFSLVVLLAGPANAVDPLPGAMPEPNQDNPTQVPVGPDYDTGADSGRATSAQNGAVPTPQIPEIPVDAATGQAPTAEARSEAQSEGSVIPEESSATPQYGPFPPTAPEAPQTAVPGTGNIGTGNIMDAHDLSPVGMFMAADWVVKGVIVSLLLASVLTWTVWLAKSLELWTIKNRALRGRRWLSEARSLEAAAGYSEGKFGTANALVAAAREELNLTAAGMDKEGVKDRIASRLQQIEATAGRQMTRGTGLLAIVGSTAPFIGLFGTVWGIMNSFIGIAEANTTNLAVVAPGIAEALLATAIGLAAAIPAVVMYNLFVRSIAANRLLIAGTAADVLRVTSRQLDESEAAHLAARVA